MASLSEPRRGGGAARTESETLVPALSFAPFLVCGESPAPPVAVADFGHHPPAALVESASPVLLANFPDPWRIVAVTPKTLGWWGLLKSLESKLAIV